MHLETKEIIHKPIEEVYKTLRDDLIKLIPYMPNIENIETTDRSEKNGKTKIINHWYAKAEIPGLIKKFLNPDLLSWKDYAEWDDEKYLVSYKLESFLANDLFDATGVNSLKSLSENETELTVSCDVVIYADKVPGIPRILAKKALPIIEGLLKKILGPNLTSLGKGLIKYYDNL